MRVVLIACLSFLIGGILGVLSERTHNTEPPPSRQKNKYFEFEQIYKKRLKQFHFGKINHKQYRDSVYTDFENYMIRNNN